MNWTDLFDSPLTVIAFTTYLLVFPAYHFLLHPLRLRFPRYATGQRFVRWRESWIRRILEQGDVTMAVQQMRNTTMVASLMASSTLLLIGIGGNFLFQISSTGAGFELVLTPIVFKIGLMIGVLAIAFTLFVNCLRRLGEFTVTIGANPKVMDETVGSAVGYLSELYGRANRLNGLGLRAIFSLFPLGLWLVGDWPFLILTILLGGRFVFVEDFAYLVRRRKEPLPDGHGSIIHRHNF